MKQFTLVFLSAPYSGAEDKDALMQQIMKVSGDYMVANPNHHVVSPLFNHYSLHLVPELGSDYTFWKDYSIHLLSHCDKFLLAQLPGWDRSEGVEDELNYAKSRSLPIEYYNLLEADARANGQMRYHYTPGGLFGLWRCYDRWTNTVGYGKDVGRAHADCMMELEMNTSDIHK